MVIEPHTSGQTERHTSSSITLVLTDNESLHLCFIHVLFVFYENIERHAAAIDCLIKK